MLKSKLVSGFFCFMVICFFFNSSAFAQIQEATISPMQSQARKPAIYQINLVFEDTIAADAAFQLSLPPQFDLSKVKVAGSNSMNGGLAVEVSGQQVTVRRSGRGDVLIPGKTYEFSVANIINPGPGQYTVEFRILSGASRTQDNPVNLTVQIGE